MYKIQSYVFVKIKIGEGIDIKDGYEKQLLCPSWTILSSITTISLLINNSTNNTSMNQFNFISFALRFLAMAKRLTLFPAGRCRFFSKQGQARMRTRLHELAQMRTNRHVSAHSDALRRALAQTGTPRQIAGV